MTGYRYYNSTQLPELNRIISRKEMGFSLEEIQKAIEEDISVQQLTRLLTLKKSEIERTVDQQLAVIRRLVEIAVLDTLALENSIARSRALIAAAGAGG